MNDVAGVRTLHSILAFHAEETPDKLFLTYESQQASTERLTFRQVNEAANRLATSLLELGLGKGERVNLHLGNRPEFLIAWFAACKAGVSIVPSNPASSKAEWTYILNHSGARATFVEESEYEAAAGFVGGLCPNLRHVVICEAGPETGALAYRRLVEQGVDRDPGIGVSADDEAAVLYTSGTTSRPKGVVITHASYIYGGESNGRHISLRSDDRYLVVLPLFHASGQIHATIPALIVGADLVLVDRFSASRYFDQVLRHEVTVGSLFATLIRMILAHPARTEHLQTKMRLALYAQNVTVAQLDEWQRRYQVPLIQVWGMTETVGLPIIEPTFGPRKRMSMGTPVLGYQVRVVGTDNQELPAGLAGELQVLGVPGRSIMKNYLNDTVATSQAFDGDWLRTGDKVLMDEDGYFFFVDRGSDLIKRAGENISASEVEACLKEHPDVADAAVIGTPDPVYDERVHALVIVQPGRSITADAVIAWCRQRLTPFKVPESVEFRQSFPRTSVGKIQRHLLRRERRPAELE